MSFYCTFIISASCPDGWEAKPQFGKCYYLIDEDVTWNEANDMCKALDQDDSVATLTSVRSQEENNYVYSLLVYNSWIGGTDETDGPWRWGVDVDVDMKLQWR